MSAIRFSRIELRNWKNFTRVDVPLANRVFLVGPNASGKSNFLDAFRFLRDLVTEGGGLAKAVDARDGMSKLRSLYARGTNTHVSIAVEVTNDESSWRYELAFSHHSVKKPYPVVVKEQVIHRAAGTERVLFTRPNDPDTRDPDQLKQAYVQQLTQNQEYRALAEFFGSVSYLHLVPHLVREGQPPLASTIGADPFGRDLLDRIRAKSERERSARLKRIQHVLTIVAAPLSELELIADDMGRPHLQARFQHWRPQGAYQTEHQFSDGTLRLIGLLWALQEKKAGPVLLEEPELSLHSALVRRLAPFIHRAQRSGGGRQVLLSTHSEELLSDEGIAPEEILLVEPAAEGSKVASCASIADVVRLMRHGITANEAVIPRTKLAQMDLFADLSL